MQLPKRRGVALTVIGAVLIVLLAPAALGIGIWRGVVTGLDTINQQPTIPSGGTYSINSGLAARSIMVEGDYAEGLQPKCRVTGPDGASVTVEEATGALSYSSRGTTWTRAGTFSPTSTGDYRIACGRAAKVMDSDVAGQLGRNLALPIGIGIGVAALSFIAGVILLIVGIVKLSNSGKERRLAQQAAGGYYPGGYYPGPQGYQGYPSQQYPPEGYPDGRPPQQKPGNPDDPYAR
ncbi:hypothetical protein [Flexivirga meconopsidis]|uniref:hypothetical protein n=1 Tax=Flexivirga meconopsidis TaxID=2977121 RepID=UPI0022407201|nr:hypothetical protein [Flexivirga meconopsidis]